MKVKDVTNYLETIAPLQLQEEYDNAGLIIGNGDDQIKGVLICLDITDEVLNEAVNTNCNLIIAHHPLIFTGLKKILRFSMLSKLILSLFVVIIKLFLLLSGKTFINFICSYFKIKFWRLIRWR